MNILFLEVKVEQEHFVTLFRLLTLVINGFFVKFKL